MKLKDLSDKELRHQYRLECDHIVYNLAGLRRASENNYPFEKMDRRFGEVSGAYNSLKKMHAELVKRHAATIKESEEDIPF